MWLYQDVRFGVRSIGKDRSFFFLSVLALALGIGAATVIFSVIDNVVLNPFPYLDSQRIYDLQIQDRTTGAGTARNWFSVPEFLDFQQQNRVFDHTLGIWEETTLLGDPNSPETLDTDLVTGDAFQMLGVPALLGRGIQPTDAQTGAQPVFVLSYKVWLKRFNLDPAVLGRAFLLNNTPTKLVGIMPPRFTFWGGDIWIPAILDPTHPGKSRFVLYGHLKPGIDSKAAQSDVAALIKHLAEVYPDRYPKQFAVNIETLGDQTIGRFKPTLYLLLGATGMTLLIACANVANLLLARGTTREKEFALRRALGASHFRLIAQLLIESLLVALSGAAAGCLFAAVGLKGLLTMLPQFTFPDEAVISLNNEVLLATVATAVLTALLFGLVPAVTAARRQSQEAISSATRGNTTFRQGRLRNGFIVSQVALSLTLLTCAGLLLRTFFVQHGVDLGVRTDHLLVSYLNLPATSYGKTELQSQFVRDLLPRLENLPGVLSVAAAVEAPPHGGISTNFDIAGVTHTSTWKGVYSPCTSRYFDTVGLRVIAGRTLTRSDENSRRRVVVINQTMADRYFGGKNPIGSRLQLSKIKIEAGSKTGSWFEVIGIFSDTKNNGTREPVLAAAYIPYTIGDFSAFNLYVHTAGRPGAIANQLTKQVLTLNRNVIPQQTLTMDDLLEITEYARPRFSLILVTTFASVGLILVMVGVYSVASYSVAQRQREIGIRMALGAEPMAIRTLVLGTSLRVMLVGIAVGICLSAFATRLFANQIWGVSRYDPMTFIAVGGILVAVGLVASYLPSRRAARVDPAICLRAD